MLERIIPFAHAKVLEYLHEHDIAVDMTCGNGNDTLFLSKHCLKVYAFDIQKDAIENTSTLLENSETSNVKLIHDSHVNVSDYITERISVAMFNLGYLPKGDPTITTSASSTIEAINNVIPLLRKKGLISITVYTGHEQGKLESNELLKYVASLSSKNFNVLSYTFINKQNSPYNIFIEKLGE